MDELLHHCLRELAFDGDLGSNPSRLSDFVADFYSHGTSPHAQKVDDAFCAFVWSFVVQQSNVLVGTKPPGISSEVWVAPQTSAKRKANAKGEVLIETSPPQLDIVEDAKSRSLDDLISQYGDDLRIAVQPDSIYAAVTGSHIRFPKLSPMVYSALQIITRGRDNGISVVELGQRSKYDQKTCFYLVKQLIDLDLVAKVRRGGVGTHFVIHKYFFDRSESWKAIREEENQATVVKVEEPSAGDDVIDEDPSEIQALDFTAIDARHLSSLPLVRARVVKLLKASKNYMHPSNNMIITIGFKQPTKTDRRFFQSRIREMLQEGIIEKVVVPNKKKNLATSVTCFRLLDENGSKVPQDGVDGPLEDDNDEPSGVKVNSTIHKLIIDLLEEAGTAGMTLNQLSSSLCNFDKRTIELLLTRAEKCPPPEHLSDLGISGLMETSGRERRHRYFTVSAYHKLVSQENLDKSSAGLPNIDYEDIGGFMATYASTFYSDIATLETYQDEFKETAEVAKEAATGKPRKKTPKNPILPDGSVKKGRPVKLDEDGNPVKSARNTKKRKLAEDETAVETPPAKKRKTAAAKEKQNDEGKKDKDAEKKDSRKRTATVEPDAGLKKRGRPRKSALPEVAGASASTPTASKKTTPPKPARSSGRQSKAVVDSDRDVDPPAVDAFAANDPPSTAAVEHVPNGSLDVIMAEPQREPTPVPVPMPNVEVDDEALPVPRLTSPSVEPTQSFPPALPSSAPEGASAAPPPAHTSPPPVEDTSRRSLLELDTHIITPDPPGAVSIPIDPALLNSPSRYPPPKPPARQAPPKKASQSISSSASSKAPPIASASRRVNVSHLRRENELFRVIEMLGGMANTQTKEMFDAHTALLETLAQAGEATSAPVGTRTDKRTAVATLNSLESQGRIKQMKTMLPGPAGVGRPTVIVYLPDTPEDKLNAFLADLARGHATIPAQPAQVKKIDNPMEYGPDPALLTRGNLPLQLLQLNHTSVDDDARLEENSARVEELFGHDDETIREVLLTERTTLGQVYGNIVAKALRARQLHMTTTEALSIPEGSAQIVSHEYRIVSLSYFCYDLPLELYCSLLSPLFHHEQLTEFLKDAESRKTLVRDLPQSLRSILQIGKSRARSRFLDILELLRCLGLVLPLIESSSTNPFIRLESGSDHPKAFDKASMEGWTVSTPTTAPTYWQFKTLAPLYHWASSEKFPPLLRTLSVSTVTEVTTYWDALREACLDSKLATPAKITAFAPAEDTKVARSLRRPASWNPKYVFTWHQTRYMQSFVDVATGKTPLDLEEDGSKTIEKICHVISAPTDAVVDFYTTSHRKMVNDIGRVRRRRNNAAELDKRSKENAEETAQAKALLAKRAAEAKKLREEEWEDLVKRVHPEPSPHAAVRLRRIQTRYLTNVHKETDDWEGEIRRAFEESEAAAAQVLKHAPQTSRLPAHHHHSVAAPPPTVDMGAREKSIQTLIAEQGPPIAPPARRAKRKRKDRDDDSGAEDSPAEPKVKIPVRRHRFQWNRDYEELARDACVIIKARCRNGLRLDWGAFEQVFPAVPRNSVRQRLTHIRETPGNDAYLNRLEDRWYELWMKHRGTPGLPDDDLSSATNFDLITHIEYLRKHIDKNAIRVGYAQPQGTIAGDTVIPSSIDELAEHFDVHDSGPLAPTWDFMWYGVVEDEREKRLASTPFTKVYGELFDQPSVNPLSIAESALKMALGTPNEHYDAEVASNFLRSAADDQTVSLATKGLLGRGVFSKLVRDHHRQKPGRQLKISDANQAQLSGPVASELFQDAAGLEESFVVSEPDAWREWPLLATDGDTAALIQLTSDNKLDFKVDTSGPQAARIALDWNSKKADDDQIETALFLQYKPTPLPSSSSQQTTPSVQAMELDPPLLADAEHGHTVDGAVSCCQRTCRNGVIDCTGCLDEQWSVSSTTLTQDEMTKAQQLLWVVGQAGDKGATKLTLMEHTQSGMGELMPIIQKLLDGPMPLLYWMGYASPLVLVSAAHIRSWTVTLPSDFMCNVFPRRWIDISGAKLMEVWGAALRAVVGTIVLRPGISQSELRYRLKTTYDRQEVYDVLQYLLDEGHIITSVDGQLVSALDEIEESVVFYSVTTDSNTKKWYQL